MELWIRSQNKKELIKINHLVLMSEEIRGVIDNGYYIMLGTYNSKERALEILDEIQELLKPKTVVKVIDTSVKIDNDLVYRPQQNMKIQQLSTYVYEMPIE